MPFAARPLSDPEPPPAPRRSQIRVLGCSGSIAALCHTTAFLLDNDILLDAGTGVGELRLDELAAIEHIFLSHSHLDHILSVPLMADSVIRLRQTTHGLRPIHIHALPATLAALREHILNDVIWPNFTRLPNQHNPLLKLEPLAIGQTVRLPHPNGLERHIEVLPAAHTVPAVGFAIQSRTQQSPTQPPATLPVPALALDKPSLASWWVYSGDTGPNPALWHSLNGRPIEHLIIETAFSNEEQHLAQISGHLAPQSLARELLNLDGQVNVHITHTKPGEIAAVIDQIRALDTHHHIEPLRSGQIFTL